MVRKNDRVINYRESNICVYMLHNWNARKDKRRFMAGDE